MGKRLWLAVEFRSPDAAPIIDDYGAESGNAVTQTADQRIQGLVGNF